ncbi:hypothetical protein DAETH_37860 (plasmid) [Deinococcus aetherius]|uniref:SRPBCC domain-containing protein n=1 Tax=Deinococcus aetherius TaxID=200252 RepID=A0ABN6RKE5_9DEIO|nr:SRPBCC family protein [Deinococcus aetherius]BDP43817.1 hypothetical protein DAETH_37860 [Deinococcus aetherius]
MSEPTRMVWPPGFDPRHAPVHTVNELFIPAPPGAVWAPLIHAALWPTWYANSRNVRLEGEGELLGPETRFRWTTFGVPVRTVVEEFGPPHRLAWRGEGLGARGYHAWTLLPVAGGTRVVTEEVQFGLVPRLGRGLLRAALLREHQRWLKGLSRLACAAERVKGARRSGKPLG